jgi:hypothetical protein
MVKLLIFMICIFLSYNSYCNDIYINRIKLNGTEVDSLVASYGEVESGRYWYDAIAGLWGYENGPTQGKAIPNVYFRGKLPADISGRGTSIFINNREIHPQEKQYLESIYGLGNVKTGRYWVDYLGNGGYEGGVAFFKIPQLQSKKKKYISPFSTRDLVGGSVIGNGYLGTDGSSASW